MARDYSDFDVAPDEEVVEEQDEPSASLVQSEAVAVGIQSAFYRFIRETLPYLTLEQQRVLAGHLPVDLFKEGGGGEQIYDANFSVAEELSFQIQAVQALRKHVFPGGRLKHDASVKEAREVVTTCNQLIRTLMDSHAKIMNMERMRAVEAATVDVLAELDPDLKEQFLERLEIKLEEIE